MCQCLKFGLFFPVQDVTVLVQLQDSTSSGRRRISSSTGVSSSGDSWRRRRATAGGTALPTRETPTRGGRGGIRRPFTFDRHQTSDDKKSQEGLLDVYRTHIFSLFVPHDISLRSFIKFAYLDILTRLIG